MAAVSTPQTELLSTAKLRLNERICRACPEPDVVVLRAAGRDRRLVVTRTQAAILEEGFADYQTVPGVLVRAIADHRCPPLREFYELIVQAHLASILVDAPPPPPPPPLRWPVRIPPTVATFLGGVVGLGSLVVLAVTIPQWRGPANGFDVVIGWLLACALLSLGHAAAASVIATAGEVRGARFHWRTRFPHFRVDTAEAIVGGRACELAVALLRAAPVLAGAAIIAVKWPVWLAGLCGGALFALAPFGHSAARQALASRRRRPRLSVREDFLFEPVRRDLWARAGAALRGFVADFGWWGVGWTLVWAGWLALALTRCMPNTTALIRGWIVGVPPSVHLGAEYLLLAAIALGLLVWLGAGVQHRWLKRKWSRPLRGADARERNRPPLVGAPADLLAQAPLFSGLDAESRATLADAMQPLEFGRDEMIVAEDDEGNDFFLIVEGEVSVRKRLPGKRRSVTVGWLGPGECFGEIALLEQTTRTATIVTSRRTKLLRLGRAQFEQLLVARVGAAKIRELLQHARFLARFTFTAGWSFAELVKFAQGCSRVRVDPGTELLRAGESNQWFYLIYDGAFEARDGARVLRRMGPGDYFGEISLLEGSAATATVVALEESRCLALTRVDFLRLFARDFRIGLRIEAIAGQRLGSDVFVSR